MLQKKRLTLNRIFNKNSLIIIKLQQKNKHLVELKKLAELASQDVVFKMLEQQIFVKLTLIQIGDLIKWGGC